MLLIVIKWPKSTLYMRRFIDHWWSSLRRPDIKFWGLSLQNTKCTDKDAAVWRARTLQMYIWFKCNISSPAWYSSWPFFVLWAGHQSSENTRVIRTKIPTSYYPWSWHIHVSEGSKRNEYLWVSWPLLYYKKTEMIPPCLCCSCCRMNHQINGMK